MQHLLAENERLSVELRVLREQQGKLDSPPAEASQVTEAMAQLMNVENEISSEFPPDFGENWAGRPRNGSSSSKADQSRAYDQRLPSLPPNDSSHQPTQFQDAHNTSTIATNTDIPQMSNTEFQVPDMWNMALPVEFQVPLLTGPELESFPPSSSNVAFSIPLQDANSTLLESSLPAMDFSVGIWVDETGLSNGWHSALPQHVDFPVI